MDGRQKELDDLAAGRQRGLVGEMWALLAENKKWWLAPVIVVMVLFGLLMLATGSAAAPFIYSLF